MHEGAVYFKYSSNFGGEQKEGLPVPHKRDALYASKKIQNHDQTSRYKIISSINSSHPPSLKFNEISQPDLVL